MPLLLRFANRWVALEERWGNDAACTSPRTGDRGGLMPARGSTVSLLRRRAAMDRTMFRDLQQTVALLFGELADERDRHVDLVGALGLRTRESDAYRAQRPLFALGIQAHGHALARAQRGE